MLLVVERGEFEDVLSRRDVEDEKDQNTKDQQFHGGEMMDREGNVR
jgi:hypothetical protein